jgi:hypothetical protein
MEDIQNQSAAPQQAAQQPPAQPVQPTTAQPVQATPLDTPKNNNKTFLIILIIVIVLVLTALAFMLFTRNNTATTLNPGPIQTLPTTVVSPAASTSSPEEQEVEQVDITDTAPTDFPQLEEEVQGL